MGRAATHGPLRVSLDAAPPFDLRRTRFGDRFTYSECVAAAAAAAAALLSGARRIDCSVRSADAARSCEVSPVEPAPQLILLLLLLLQLRRLRPGDWAWPAAAQPVAAAAWCGAAAAEGSFGLVTTEKLSVTYSHALLLQRQRRQVPHQGPTAWGQAAVVSRQRGGRGVAGASCRPRRRGPRTC